MEVNKNDYNDIFLRAKDSTVYTHAMVYIQAVMDEKGKTERQKFLEIHKIVIEAVNHLSDEE